MVADGTHALHLCSGIAKIQDTASCAAQRLALVLRTACCRRPSPVVGRVICIQWTNTVCSCVALFSYNVLNTFAA
jgi:hypothetical protein